MDYPQVVKIFATTQSPDYDLPWQTRPPASSTGSGVIISEREILTGAHVVADATFIQVQKPLDPDKKVAVLKAACHDCDLALIEVAEPIADDLEPATVGDLPLLRDKVSVVGFPVGGEEVSITEGVVSRIEVQRYSHSQRYLLAITVDAAINEGNSGGPVFKDGKVVGIAFQKLDDADNIGELVPAPLIQQFLRGVREGRSPDVPGLGISTQNLENPMMRAHRNLGDDESGVLITAVEYGGSCWDSLSVGDILMEIDGYTIANNGTIMYGDRHRTQFDAVLGTRFVDDKMPVRVKHKDGAVERCELALKPMRRLIARSRYGVTPTYFVFAGLVFQPVTRDFLTSWGEWQHKSPKEFLYYYDCGMRTEARREVIGLSQIFADEINVGYDHLYDEAVTTVNGERPVDMADFVRKVESARDYVEIGTSSSGMIVIDVAAARSCADAILERYQVPADRSPNLISE